MAVLEIVTVSSPRAPILREKTRPVECFDENLRALAENMTETMWHEHGIGIAAPQVGEYLALVVVDIRQSKETKYPCTLDGEKITKIALCPLLMANPRIEKFSMGTVYGREGCLSVPDVRENVRRSKEITVVYQDMNAESHRLFCGGILAICIQHEIDHLNGILFIDRVERKE
ncbi:MAG: peptide deformylase [Puniceicoccales bacterium]|jgi:peptide deformylase|nr:peptide deformylase [Puniceicoccales bacterium]